MYDVEKSERVQGWKNRTANLEKYKAAKVDKGVVSDVFKLTEEGHPTLYLRILPKWAKSANIEVAVLQALKERNVKVPQVVHFENNVHEFDGRSCLVIAEVPGIAIDDRKVVPKGILREAGRDLARMHELVMPGFGYLSVRDGKFDTSYESYSDYVFGEIYPKLSFIESNKALPEHLMNRLVSNIRILSAYAMRVEQAVAIHGDYGRQHIYYQDRKYTGMIDLGNVIGGSRYADLGKLYVTDGHIFERIVKGYNEVFPLPPNFMQIIALEALFYVTQKIFYKCKNGEEVPQKYLKFISSFDFSKISQDNAIREQVH